MKEFNANKILVSPSNQLNRSILTAFNGNEIIGFSLADEQIKELLNWLSNDNPSIYTLDGKYVDEEYQVVLTRTRKRSIKYAILQSWQISDTESGNDGEAVQYIHQPLLPQPPKPIWYPPQLPALDPNTGLPTGRR